VSFFSTPKSGLSIAIVENAPGKSADFGEDIAAYRQVAFGMPSSAAFFGTTSAQCARAGRRDVKRSRWQSNVPVQAPLVIVELATLPRNAGAITSRANAGVVRIRSGSTDKSDTQHDNGHAEPLSPQEILFEEMLRGERNQGKLQSQDGKRLTQRNHP